ncbi:MAG: phosphatase PAP2 family protein [Desulfatiglandaceae bacterium]
MILKVKVWITLFVVTGLLIIGARYVSYFPGDVAVARFVQWITLESTAWAQRISSTAKSPWNLFLIGVTGGLSWWLAGWRAILLALAGFAGMWLLGKALGPIIGRPRPSPDLVHVVDKLSGYSFPSIFGMTYASTIGFLAVLFNRKASGVLRISVITFCSLLLLVGGAARVGLGAYSPSDVILSYLVAMLWAYFLIRFA